MVLIDGAVCSFVESGFWNFDTLFVPQQHPARDLQDTVRNHNYTSIFTVALTFL